MKEEAPHISPMVKGLVLTGGASTRMGFDKGLMDYHGMPQQEYLLQLLAPYVTEVFISCRPDQRPDSELPVMEDSYENLGPFGAILTAFKYDPNSAWLVVACDFPLLDRKSLEQLIMERNSTSYATSFLDERALMPEPWITILEPKIYPILLEYHQRGRSSLRGVLVDYNGSVIRAHNADVLLNANTPEEAEALRQRLSEKR